MAKNPITRIVVLTAVASLALGGAADAAKQGKGKPKPGKVKERTATATGVANGLGNPPTTFTATAICPKKHRVVGGGFTAPVQLGTGGLVPYESQREGNRSWRVSANALGPAGTSFTIVSYAYCRKGAPSSVAVSASTPSLQPPALTSTIATCPGTRRVIGGGVSGPPALNAVGAPQSFVIDAFAPSSATWQTRSVANSAAGPLTSLAYCANAKKAPAFPSVSSPPLTNGQSATLTANCTGKRKAVGGGFSQQQTSNSLILIAESRRTANGWSVSGVATNAVPSSFSAQAICVR
jgi:hypothetical protein